MSEVAAISSAVMAIVWVIYFQLFFIQFKRARRPYLVIHHAQNDNPDALCLLVNMSQEAVHVLCVQAVLEGRDGVEVLTVTDYQRVSPDSQDVAQALRQGPLQAGGFLVLGSFRGIIRGQRSEDDDGEWLANIRSLEIRAAVVHGPSRHPVGVRRRFYLDHTDGTRITPRNIHTEQLHRLRDRATVRRWIESELNPRRTGSGESDASTQSQQQPGEER